MDTTWQSFGPDVLVAVIGAVIGAVLTVGIALATYFVSIRHRAGRALNVLIQDLHGRRALIVPETIGEVPGAAGSADYERLSLSVLAARDLLRQTQALPGVSTKVWEELAVMTRSCNRYLEDSSSSPSRYVILAATLHDELTASVRNLLAARRGLQFLEPGAGAY